jgi:hypothetical protein
MKYERGQLTVGVGVVQSGPPGDVAALDRLHGVRDHLRDERGVDRPEGLARDAVGEQPADPVGGDPGVAFVDRPGRRESGDVVEEGPAGRLQGVRDRVQVGGDPAVVALLPGDRGLDVGGGVLEVVLDHLDRELFLARRQRVQRGLAAAQLGGQVVQREAAESVGQEQRQQPVLQLGLPPGASSV